LKIFGRAIRKIKSKLRVGTEIFSLSEIEFIQGKTYKTLTDTVLIDRFKNIKDNPEKLETAFQISQDLNNLVQGEEPDEKIWDLLKETFQRLNKYPLRTINYSLVYYYFFWNLISILGYKPEFYHCSICQKKLLPRNLYFSSKESGIICESCFQKMDEKTKALCLKININVVKILRLIVEKNWGIFKRLKIEKEDEKNLSELPKNFR
jgi:DNA repair protein RecO (recombination protein O)